MRRLGGCALALFLLGVGAGALAQEATEPTDSPEVAAAKGHWQAGRAYFEKGDMRRALVEFRQAAREVDRPQLDFNIASTYERLGDAARAVENYQRYLARAPETSDRSTIEQRLAVLRRQIGTLVVTSTVAGTAFLVDEESFPSDLLAKGMAITAGPHRVVASKEGFLSRTIEVQVPAGETGRAELSPLAQIVERPAPAAAPPTRRWLWPVVGSLIAVVVLGAAATTAGVLLSNPEVEKPYKGNVNPGFIYISP